MPRKNTRLSKRQELILNLASARGGTTYKEIINQDSSLKNQDRRSKERARARGYSSPIGSVANPTVLTLARRGLVSARRGRVGRMVIKITSKGRKFFKEKVEGKK